MTDGEERAWDKVSDLEDKVNQLEDTEKELADYHIKYLFFKKLSEENAELKTQLERAKVYLKATSDLLQKQNESHYVLNLLNTTVFYDEADCDGYCLKDEIDTFLETGV